MKNGMAPRNSVRPWLLNNLWVAVGMSLGVLVFSPREESNDEGLSLSHEMVIQSSLDSFKRAWERFDSYSSRVNSLEEALRVADPEWLKDRVEARVYSVPIDWRELFASR